MKKLLLFVCLALIAGVPATARKKKPVPPKTEAKAPVTKGFFNVQHEKDNWVFQIPDSLLGRPFLAVTRYVATPVNMGIYGGEMANSQVLYWEKHDKQMFLRTLMYDAHADSTMEIYKAVKSSSEDPIVASFKIDSTSKKCSSITVNRLFMEENQVISIPNSSKTMYGLGPVSAERSFIKSIHTYPINTEIRTVRTYAGKETSRIIAGAYTGYVTFEMNTSFVLLPEKPMRRRVFDPRVGYFADSFEEFSDDQQSVKRERFITRWRLEPKDSADMEKMKRGELVEPKKQIVYYIDPATPKQWRKYLIQGVNDWNVAFEQAGFKNAIVAKEWPNDSTMSMEDARYSVIRYLASDIPNAYGPQVHDPRSGEIIESHIGWYHNVMQLVHDWYMIQAGCIDQRADKMKFDDELMGDLIRFVSSHEVGHTLGLRHNMGASSATPVDSLRDKAWVEAHGHTASIMDYARFNYVAQPEDHISTAGIYPRINDYDKWAIKWGYMPIFDTKDEKADQLILNKMTIKQLAQSRRYWFGGEGYDNDPRAQTEDLSDDAMKASEYGIKNLKRVVKALPQWTYEEGDMNTNLSRVYGNVIAQFNRYVGHVCRNIGGVYVNYKSIEQNGAVYTPEEKARQMRALAFIDRNVFTMPSWLVSESYVSRLSDSPEGLLQSVVDRCLYSLLSSSMMDNLCKYAYAKDAYQPGDYVNDLVKMIFSETTTGAKVTSYRRYLQRQTVNRAVALWQQSSSSDGHAYSYSMLRSILSRVRSARTTDATTKAHYMDLAQTITLALEKK
jgi:hypothetical protein